MRLRTISLTTRQGCEGRGQPSGDGSPLSRERARTTPRLLIAAHYFWGSSEHRLNSCKQNRYGLCLTMISALNCHESLTKVAPTFGAGGLGGSGPALLGGRAILLYYATTLVLERARG